MLLLYVRIQLLLRFLGFFLRAQTKYNIHSPFVYRFLTDILEDNRQYYAFQEIEKVRDQLLQNHRFVPNSSYGAGSQVNTRSRRRISDICRYNSMPAATGQLLFKLIQTRRPQYLIELGTSLGISGLYQAGGKPTAAHFYTLEGALPLAEIAAANFDRFGLSNVEVLTGDFAVTLPKVLAKLPQLDYVLLDGDHRRDQSLHYFLLCLGKATEQTVFVVADIYWSKGMQEAWQQMQTHPAVHLSIDLYEIGLLFLDPALRGPHHYRLVPSKWKPWKLGWW